MIRSQIASTGSYLPNRVLSNQELETMVDTTDEWIVQRTGIQSRHISEKAEKTSDMAVYAAKRAIDAAAVSASDIDGVIVATATADRAFPSVAVAVQAALQTGQGPCFDVSAACSGFIYALSTADALIRTGQASRFLVIGAEKFSSIMDWSDRTTCVLFGDGAGAVILEAGYGEGEYSDRGVLGSHLHANGNYQEMLYVDGGIAQQEAGFIRMQGQNVFKFAVNSMHEIIEETLNDTGITAAQIDWLIPHQANIRIIEAMAKKMQLPMEKVIVTVHKHGNTSAASIPLALDYGVKDGRVKEGDLLVFEGLGGGFTWASALLRF